MSDRPSWWSLSRWRGINPLIPDGLLAAALTLVGVLTLVADNVDELHPRHGDPFGYFLVVVCMGSLALRRSHPFEVLCTTVVATTIYSALGYVENGLPIAALVALYTVATLAPRRLALVGLALVAIAIVAGVILDENRVDLAAIATNFALFGIAWVVGDNLRVRRAYLEQLELRADDAEQRQREAAERAVAEERLSIARELHDVVAHAMSVVTVQSGVGAHVIDQHPDEAKQILSNINVTSREALNEMRRLLGVLRAEEDQPEAVMAPSPTLEGVPALADTMEAAGVPVTVEVTGDRANVPPGVDLSAFRIVQEALTNVLKHAGPAASVAVTIAYADDRVELVIADDGRGMATHVSAGTIDDSGGHGLVGMRERVAVYGGSLDVGPRSGGGFQVRATLPFAPVGLPA